MSSSIPVGDNYLVTGATGFIGGRLVEKLCLENPSKIKAYVRNPCNAINIGRFPIQKFKGEIHDKQTFSCAVSKDDLIFHCAHDFEASPKQNAKATQNILNAAIEKQAKKVIILSTADVYAAKSEGWIDERSALTNKPTSKYVDSKIAVEEVCRTYIYKHKAPVVIIQPTIVFGPWCKPWTQRIFDQMAMGKLQLVNEGKGICNCIYIDDLVDMMIKAAKQPNIDGETFIASNPTPLTWKQFYGYFEEIIGQKRTVEQVKASKSFNSNWLRQDFRNKTLNLRQKITPLLPRDIKDWVKAELRKWQNTEKPIPLNQEQEAYFASTAKFDVRKAVDKLGFVPAFKHEEGFNQVNHWYHHFYSS